MVKHKYQSFPDDQMKRYLNTKILRVSLCLRISIIWCWLTLNLGCSCVGCFVLASRCAGVYLELCFWECTFCRNAWKRYSEKTKIMWLLPCFLYIYMMCWFVSSHVIFSSQINNAVYTITATNLSFVLPSVFVYCKVVCISLYCKSISVTRTIEPAELIGRVVCVSVLFSFRS